MKFTIEPGILVRGFELSDIPAVYRAVDRNREHLSVFMHWMTPDYNETSAEEFVLRSIANRDARTSLSLGMFRDDELLGSIGYVYFDWSARKTEIGYWISKNEEGKGIVTRACRRLIDIAFRELGLNRVEIRCSAENKRSSAIPVRLGFVKEGVLRQAENRNGRFHDFEIYGLLAGEWDGGNADSQI